MAVYQALLLNTVVPQIQAAQTGDSYVMVVNATTDALRITQTGTGNALVVEDSSNPDATPFVVSAAGDVGIGTGSPGTRLHVASSGSEVTRFATSGADMYLRFVNSFDSNGYIGYQNAAMTFWTANTLKATLDASGNLIVGGTSALVSAASRGNITINGASDSILAFGIGNANTSYFYNSSTSLEIAAVGDRYVRFSTNGSERARITSGGEFRLGTDTYGLASNRKMTVLGTAGIEAVATGTTGEPCLEAWQKHTSGDNTFVSFLTEGTATTRGSITYNRAGGLVAYNTTSDYRAKDILGPFADSGATIDALKVYNGKMKGATVERPMLVAHEAQAVTPYAVTGEKDAVNDDDTPKYQQMDVSSLVPLLIAEIQSLRARVAQLEAK